MRSTPDDEQVDDKDNASTTKVMISNASGVSAMIPYTNLCM